MRVVCDIEANGLTNPTSYEKWGRKYYNKNKDKFYLNQVKWRKKNPIKKLLQSTRRRARSLGLEYNLETGDVVIPSVCPILGLELAFNEGLKGNSISLDRIDNSKGYVKGNVAVISNKANSYKGDMTKNQIENMFRYSQGLL